MAVCAVFEYVAGLAVEGTAEGLAGGHLAAGEHYVYVYDYCHGC